MTTKQNLVFYSYGKKASIPRGGGKSLEWRRFENIAVGTHVLTEGTAPAETQATYSNVAATISQYGAYAKISDLLQLQNFDPVIADFSEGFGYHAARVMDTVVRDVVSATTTIQYAGTKTVVGTSGAGAVGSGDYLDSSELLEARRTLRRADVPPVLGNKYVCILHPDSTMDLFQDPVIVDAFKDAGDRGGNNPLFTGELGDWMGFKFVETTNLLVNASNGMSGADIYNVIVLGKEAYGIPELSAQNLQMIVHPLGSGGHTDPLEQYSTIGWKVAFASRILNQNYLVKVLVASSRTPAA